MKKGLYLIFGLVVLVASFIYLALPHLLFTQEKINIQNLSGAYDYTNQDGVFYGKKLVSTDYYINNSTILATNILGDSTAEKRILVDLSEQKLYAYEGPRKVYEFLVSSGLWGTTPTGEFYIWIKLKSTRMSGGSKELGTYYDLPNVPYTMYFSNSEIPKERGYALHGTYWHNNFGHPMSHGCINLSTEDSKTLYEWADPVSNGETMKYADPNFNGTKIIIFGKSPLY